MPASRLSAFLVLIFAAAVLAFSRPRDFNIATFGAFATILSLVGFVVALAAPSWALVIAPIGVATGLYVSIAGLYQERADAPRLGEWDYRADRVSSAWWEP